MVNTENMNSLSALDHPNFEVDAYMYLKWHFPCGVMCSHMVYVGYRTFSLPIWILISSSIEPSAFF